MTEGTIETVKIFSDANGSPIWWKIKLEGVKEEFLLHHNWMGQHGPLIGGDKVRYIISKAKMSQRLMFDNLRKVEEEKEEGWEEAAPEL